MSEQKTPVAKKNPGMIAMIVVLVVAIIAIVVLFVRSGSLNDQLDALNTELSDTNAAYQQTVTDKTAVEEQLKAAENDLREARTTLEESTAKVADLEGQLTALTEENNANKATIATLTADLATAKANKEAAEVYLANVETSIQMALNALNGVTPAPAATPEPVVEPEATAEPVNDETAEEVPAAEPETEAAVEPEATAEPVNDETAEEVPAVEPETETETAVEPEATAEPVTDETAETPVDAVPVAPLTEAEVIAPVVTPNEDGTYTVALNEQTLTVSFDENMAVKTLAMADVEETLLAQFIGKTLPLDVTTLTLDEAGVAANIAQLLNNASFPVTLPAEEAPAA